MRGMQFCLMGLASLTLAAVLGSCGKVAPDGDIQLDSNTNWLKRCESNAECSGALVCLCGQCTQPCAETSECSLLSGASCGSASGSACQDSPGAGGLCVLECTSARECADAQFTCNSGQCVPLPRIDSSGDDGASNPEVGPATGCTPDIGLNMDDVFRMILQDLSSSDDADRINYRYLSLANRWNAGLCEADLQIERAAMIKALNSVSRSGTTSIPTPIDESDLIYRIDLRDYIFDRPVTIGGQNYNDVWEVLVTYAGYSIAWVGDDADDAVAETGTNFPVMFASAFVAAATDAPVYYELIGMRENVNAFILEDLGIDTAANLAREEAVRAGFSGTSLGSPDAAFIAERHDLEVRYGSLWQVAAFGGTPSDLFANPLGAPAGEREIIFTLENGLLAFAFADSGGNRLDASSAFSSSPQLPLRASFGRYGAGVSVSDEVHAAATTGLLDGYVTEDEMAHVLAIYPEPNLLTAMLDDDRSLYGLALNGVGLDIDASEPITRTYANFIDDVDLNVAAGDLMLTPDQLLRALGELDESLHGLENGRVSRDEFSRSYVRSVCTLTVASENTPDIHVCAAFSGP